MCGIVGYIGTRQAYPILISGLHRLEYRGYDSAGVALLNEGDSQSIAVYKAKGKVRPMTVERKRSISDRLLPKGRKNSLTFGSHAGVEVSVIYHTFIETCKMCGVSTLEYFKEFFKAIMQGRTDYERSAMPLCLQRTCCQ